MKQIPFWAFAYFSALVLGLSACAASNEPQTPQQAVVEQLEILRSTDQVKRLAFNTIFLTKPIGNAAVVVFSERVTAPTNRTIVLGISATERTSRDWRTIASIIGEPSKENRAAVFSTFQAFTDSDHRIIFGRTLVPELTQVVLSLADGQQTSTDVENDLFALDVSRSVTPCQIQFLDAANQSRFVIKAVENLDAIEAPALRQRIQEKCQ